MKHFKLQNLKPEHEKLIYDFLNKIRFEKRMFEMLNEAAELNIHFTETKVWKGVEKEINEWHEKLRSKK